MTKFNKPLKRQPATGGPIRTAATSNVQTYNGAAGYEYDTLSQLFLLACNNLVGEDTFYETGNDRHARFTSLIGKAVAEGHTEWLGRFWPWLRNEANLRTASVVGAVETAKHMVHLGIPGGRKIVNEAMSRADEPGEALAYYMATHNRHVPKAVKRGIADAVTRLYTQRSALRYDTESKGLRFGDVLELVHAAPSGLEQSALFQHLVTAGKGRDIEEISGHLSMIRANRELRKQAQTQPELLLNFARLHTAGMSWEAAKSLAGKRVDDKALWEALIPSMGYMALLRNLRNFDEAGIKGDTALWVSVKLADPAEVAKSRQLPLRFLSAYREVPSNNYSLALEHALDASLASVPSFPGRTLILVDTSGSMMSPLSARSKLHYWDAAALFGLAVASRCEAADVVSFASSTMVFPEKKGESLLRAVTRWNDGGFFQGSGTDTYNAVRNHYKGHDRVIVLTDEQCNPNYGIFGSVPGDKQVVTFNLAGYRQGHAPVGDNPRRVAIGGLSDVAFRLLPALEGRGNGVWPF